MATITTIRDKSWHVVNRLGRSLYTSSERDLVDFKAGELAEIHDEVEIVEVQMLERRKLVRRVSGSLVEALVGRDRA